MHSSVIVCYLYRDHLDLHGLRHSFPTRRSSELVFVPEINLAMNIFQPNADSVYRSAMIDAKGTYRLLGKRGPVSYFKMAQLRDMIRTHQRSEEHTSELQSLMRISHDVICLLKKNNNNINPITPINIHTTT